jgi:hypothetical protein
MDWLRGDQRVWVEIKKFDKTEIIIRKLHTRPFGGIAVLYYWSIDEGEIFLTADGKGVCPTRDYIQVLRWAVVDHKPMKEKFRTALTMGEIDKPWEKAK